MGVKGFNRCDVKDITELEFSFDCWVSIAVDDLENAELWRSGRVKKFWMKALTLYMKLDDDTIVEEDMSGYDIYEEYKWPTKTMVQVNDNWKEVIIESEMI